MRKEFKSEEGMEVDASGSMHSSSEQTVGNDYCQVDFPMGKPDSCDCSADHHELILSEATCEEAALEEGATMTNDWIVAEGGLNQWQHKHPRGCFKGKCAEGHGGQCYFFNPIGDYPHKCKKDYVAKDYVASDEVSAINAPPVTGVPVCKRKVFKFAASLQTGGWPADGGCPNATEYSVIMDQAVCRVAAGCVAACAGGLTTGQFITTHANQSRFDDFPLGCFKNHGDNCIYYNPQLENWGAPKSPKGTPLCYTKHLQMFADHVDTKGSGTANVEGRSSATQAPTLLLEKE